MLDVLSALAVRVMSDVGGDLKAVPAVASPSVSGVWNLATIKHVSMKGI